MCFGTLALQSCAGWGDVFAPKRTVVDPYFLMTSGDGKPPSQYFLFKRDRSGSIAGPIIEIGWDQQFILVWDEGSGHEWRIFAVDPRQHPVPTDDVERQALFEQLRKDVRVHPIQQVWDQSR
jgi:hypothetical protein